MAPEADILPEDPALLQAMILGLGAEIAGMTAANRAYEALVQALKITIAKLKKQRFGASSEKVFAGQLVAQNMLIQILMGQIVLSAPDGEAVIREALVQGTGAIRSNPNMTEAEKFGAVKTLEDALDTLDRIAAARRG